MTRMSLKQRAAVTSRGLGLLRKYCPGLIQGRTLHELIDTLQPFATVWLSARIIDEISGQRRVRSLVLYAAVLVLTNFLCSICKGIVQRVCDEKEGQMWSWFRTVFSHKQMSLDFADLDNAQIKQQKQKAEENLFMFGNGLAQLVWGTPTLVRVFVNILASVAMTVTLFAAPSHSSALNHPVWIPVLLLCIALGGLCNSRATEKENELFVQWTDRQTGYYRAKSFFGQELYMNPDRAKDVRIYRQNRVTENVLNHFIRHDGNEEACIFRMSAYPAVAGAVIGIANAMCYLFVVLKAFFGAFGVGSIVQYVMVLSRLSDGVQEMMYMLSDNKVYCQYLQELFAYLDIPSRENGGTLPVTGGNRELELEFDSVSFRYPGTEHWALKDISLTLKPGKRMAIVGMNGSGKTTFIKLICRLYEPTEGKILLNGIDIREYDYHDYMSILSVVFQDFKLFSFSIAQNIAASAQFDAERAIRCLEATGFKERLHSLPHGIDTCLYKDFDKEGVEISGGEAQKIALARALYKDAPLIILDEPTAALDPIAEAEIYSRFNEITGSRTAIYISHRLSSCKFCDEIVVFHEGAIVQQGTHDELLSMQGGKYRELWSAQAQYYNA